MSSLVSRLGGAAARGVALLVIATCTSDHIPTVPLPPQTAPVAPPPVSAAITASPQAVQLIGAGNIARCDRTNDEATALLLDAYPDATVFAAGDNMNGNGSLTNFTTCYGPSWGRHKARTRPAAGEKEYKTAGAAGYFSYFGAAAGDSGKYYYSYDLGAWHIMVLNDNISMAAGSAQEQWLRAELAANTRQCTLAYWHHPRFSSSGTNKLASVKPLWDALYAYSADVVVNAHYTVYERFAPQTPDGVADPVNGTREFIVGTGGLSLQNPGGAKPNSEVRNGTTYGVLKLTLDTDTYSWEFVPIAGQTFSDAGTTACHTRIAVASVEVTPPAATALVGATVQLAATPKDAAGNPLTGRAVAWQTSDATIATVDATGLVTGKAAGGPVTITATSEGKNGTSAVTITLVPVASVDVTPPTATVQAGATVQLTATPRDANGNSLSGRVVTWQTTDLAIATVDATGLVTGKTVGGPITITATSEGKSGTSSVTITPVPVASVDVTPAPASVQLGATRQLTAAPKDANGNPLTGRVVTWQTADAAIATVDANGLVTGKTVGGPVTITATSEGKSGASAVTVTPIPVASVDVTPPTGSIVVDATLQLTATPKDANGNPLTGRVVTWQTADATVATVDANGLVTGKGAGGPVAITAASEGKSGMSAITVTLTPVASVDVAPPTGSIQVGATLQLTATPKDANGKPLTGRTITWQSGDATIASVDGTGVVSGKAAGGPITIMATVEGKSGTAAVTVTLAPVASVVVTPATATILVNGTVQLTATLKDANGNPLTGRSVTWQTGDAAVADVNAGGMVTGKTVGGPVTITATSEGKSGTAAVTVSASAPVATVDVAPPTASVQVGASTQLTATPKDANGNPLSGRVVIWRTGNATIADVDANGLVTGKAAGGPITIMATSEGTSGTSAVTVTPIPVASLAVTPATASIQVNGTVQLTATPKDATGNPLSGRVVTWQTSNATIAMVDGNGLVTGKALGGPITITATSEGKSGTASVSVTPAPVASVAMSPTSATIFANGTVQLTATPKDANGNELGGRAMSWASSTPGVATVNARGFVVGLQPGTANVTATSEGVVGMSVVTVQNSSGAPVIAGAGDIADCSRMSQEGTARVLDGIVGTVVTFGDQAYPDGSYTDYMNCYDASWGRHRPRTRPSPGNHEYNFGSSAGAPGYYQYFGAAAGDPSKGYYSYDLGAWHLIVINSNLPMNAGSAQEQWLRADLAAHPTVCTVAYWHHPRFSSGGNGSTPATQPIWQALYDFGADLVLNGHDHDYERFAPQTPTGARDDANGIREIIAGTGGNSLYGWPGNPIANSELRSNVNYGILKVTLWPTSYDWDFIPVAGGTFSDHGSALCHSGAPLPNQAPIANPGGPYGSEGTVTLDGGQSRDPDNNTPLSYSWTLGDGATASTATVTHTYPAEGQYTVTLTVTDSRGAASAPATTTVTIANIAPTVNAGPDQAVVAGAPVSLRATFSDPGPTDYPWTYTIAWGDGATDGGSTNTQANPITGSHVFAAPGHYTARVTVTDKDGGAGFDDLVVTVLDPSSVQVFSGAGNIATCGTDVDEATAKILDNLPGSVFVLGDNVNPSGSAANYTNCYDPTWGRHKARTHPTIGNHEYDVVGASGYFGYFGAAAGDPTKGYYSFDLGDYWHVVVLNNTASVASGAGSVEEQWLKADLAASSKRCTLAMFHYPLFFSSDDPSWHSASGVIPIWNDLYAAGAEIVLNGQQYDYERFAPQDPGGNPDPARGIREFNVGVGGYATAMPSSIAPNTEAVSDAYGVLKLTLGPDTYTWEFIPAAGGTFTDSGSGSCH